MFLGGLGSNYWQRMVGCCRLLEAISGLKMGVVAADNGNVIPECYCFLGFGKNK